MKENISLLLVLFAVHKGSAQNKNRRMTRISNAA